MGGEFRALRRLVGNGAVGRMARGLCRVAEAEQAEHYTVAAVCARVPGAIVRVLSALSVHELTTQIAWQGRIAIPQEARRPRLGGLPIRVVRFSGTPLRSGVVNTPASSWTQRGSPIRSIRIDQPDGGLRVRIRGGLGGVRPAVPVDIGFAEVITLRHREEDYPTLRDLPAPYLWTYPRETMVAEKFHAMASLGDRNSRVKDLWDVACLARRFAFDGYTSRTAIAETFRHCGTSLTDGRPRELLAGCYDDHEAPERRQRWREMGRQIGTDVDGPDRLVEAGEELRRFLGPVCNSRIEEGPFTQAWPAGGLWRSGAQALTGDRSGG